MKRTHAFAAMLGAAVSLSAHAACPGRASWCDDFENGAARWQASAGAPQPRIEPGTANRVLEGADGAALLIADSETSALTRAAYYVEARLRPSAPAAGTSRAFLLARYADSANWIGAGATFTSGSKRMTVELTAMRDGKLVRLKQVGRDTEAGNGFHTLRLELAGDALAVYLNGERLTSVPMAFQPGGRTGVLAESGRVDVDDVRIGAAGIPLAVCRT